jgi:hypothetical protein
MAGGRVCSRGGWVESKQVRGRKFLYVRCTLAKRSRSGLHLRRSSVEREKAERVVQGKVKAGIR